MTRWQSGRCGTREGLVTMGRRTCVATHEWLAGNRYRDYLYLHGLCVEMAEAFAEHFHERIHGELRHVEVGRLARHVGSSPAAVVLRPHH
jgi:hypothetical protein